MRLVHEILEKRALKKRNINASKPRAAGVTKAKRQQEIIISLTSYPARIGSVHKTIRTLLHQDMLPDRVILWLATEQFPEKKGIPKEVLDLQRFGLEIRWYHDIRSYKKLIPTMREFPDAIIVTVDDDWYYRTDMLRVLLEEHEKHPNEIICHDATCVRFNEEGGLISCGKPKSGSSSCFNKLLGGSGAIYPPNVLDEQVLDEKLFMEIAPTNDDIWFWAMAVKKGTKIRLAEKAMGNTLMTDPEMQFNTSLGLFNSSCNIYGKLTNLMLEMFPEIMKNLNDEIQKQ